ncbi:unnamed protein product [Mytilus edulis]|uniref:Uncharacterized protein n=1 Tax=Mytilus edulis TaxID=6550 RepID=A0A8S3T4Q6_MYTED|nr:unnamed protein product [Mytilus edulis]
MYTTKSAQSVNTKPVISSISSTTSFLSTVDSTVLSLITSKEISGGLIAGGVVAGLLVLLLPLGIIFYRRRCSNTTKSPRNKFVTRSNPAYESDIDVGTDGNPYKNKDSSLYHHYFEVQNDPDIVTQTHNYINTDTMTYDYASGHGSLKDDTYDLKDDTYDNMKQGINVKQHSKGIDLNTYSHLQDTFIDSDENTYNHTIHDRVPSMTENDYSMSRGQMSDDDYDVSGNYYRGHHIDGSEAVYN